MDSVVQSWDRITGWLQQNLPAALECIEPPASPEDLREVSAAAGSELPPDLITWLRLVNGMAVRVPFGSLLPTLYVPFSCARMLERRDQLTAALGGPSNSDPAGTRSIEWHEDFLPIGDSWSDPNLVVDLRAGEQFGCIGEFDLESEGFEAPWWSSTTEMLFDVAEALVSGRPALADYAARATRPWRQVPAYIPQLEDGRLVWQPAATG
ncbi:SMI1/KNR4 family protein [Kribbella lupini]|uniref:Knr4/Smi1-like domain-containing protein n=1 Tax=Kribbella lupini TaxID=291602 RepID=A0ABN2B9N2_9ACTN